MNWISFSSITANWIIVFALLVLASSSAMRVGIFCLSIEAIFLNTAICFALGNSFFLGLLYGIIAGIITSIIFYLMVVVFKLEEIVSGIALNLFSIGITSLFVISGSNSRYISLDSQFTINNIHLVLFIILSVLIWILSVYLLDKSVFRNRFIALGQSEETARISNISINGYRGIALLITGVLSIIAGLFFTISQGGIGTTQWNEGIGFLALGVAFASRGASFAGLSVAFILAIFRSISLIPTIPQWLPIPELILHSLPYIFVVLLIALFGLIKIERYKIVFVKK